MYTTASHCFEAHVIDSDICALSWNSNRKFMQQLNAILLLHYINNNNNNQTRFSITFSMCDLFPIVSRAGMNNIRI